MQTKKKEERFSKKVFTDDYSSSMSNPEYIGKHMAQSISKLGDFKVGVELCSCIGINVIQLAMIFDKVVGVDFDEDRIEKSFKNAELYGVSEKTDFILGDVLDENLLKKIKADFAVLDPEWSTRKFDRSTHVSDIDMTKPNLRKMFDLTKKHITDNIIARVPATMSFEALGQLGFCKLENIIINDEVIFRIAYFSSEIKKNQKEDICFI